MKIRLLLVLIIIFLTDCGNRTYNNIYKEGPSFRPNVIFQGYEDLTSPGFSHLIEKYQLDTIFHGETDEFKRILLLRHWVKSVIAINDFGDPYPGAGNVEAILDEALKGQGYHCGHFMLVQNAIMNAYGYVTRTLGAGPGIKGGPDGHHGINEIWLNNQGRWFLSDAKYDHHFEKNGIPLSALEVRDEYLKNKAADIKKVKGPERIEFDVDAETGYSQEENARTYTWIEWHGYNNTFTIWPKDRTLLVMYEDDYFRNNTWIWGGNPHWAYAKPEYMKLVQSRDQIYWTPNTISSNVTQEGNTVKIGLNSETPNLKSYQMSLLPSDKWVPSDTILNLKLKKKKNEFLFRTINLAGVTGPEHRVVIERN